MDISALAQHQVIAIDGLSGSGKSTLAQHLSHHLPHRVVAVEDFVPGWHHLAEGVARVETELLAPYRQGKVASAATYDWETGQIGPEFTLHPGTPILLEGCGAGAMNRELIDLLIWIEIDEQLRHQRLNERADFHLYLPYRQIWHDQEVQLANLHHQSGSPSTKDRADLVVEAPHWAC